MPAYSVPGVYVSESPLQALTASNGGQAVGAFFGEARRGPTVPTLIQDWSSYVSIFGAIEDQYDLGYAVYHYFANGGRSCYVTRVTGAASVTADSLAAESEGVQWEPNNGTLYQLFDVTAISEGDWGNGITVAAIPGTIPPSATNFGSFTVVIELDGVEVERWVDCEVDPNATRFVETVVNQYSNFVRVSNVVNIGTQNIEDVTITSGTATVDITGHGYIVGQSVVLSGISFNSNLNGAQTITAVTTDTFDFTTGEADDAGPNVGGTARLGSTVVDEYVTTKFPLDDGVDAAIVDADYTTSLDGLDSIEGNLIINLPGITATTPVSSAVTKAGARGDSFVIIDPDKTDTTLAELQTTASNFAAVSPLSYAAHYAPALEMVDPARSGPSAVRTTAPGGAIAGLYVRTDVQRTVAKAPAGYDTNIVGAFSPSFKLTPTQTGTLYVDAVPVNSFKSVPGAGVIVNGARTLAKVDPDRYINVRRTLNYLKYSLKELTAFAVFESNDDRLWERLRQTTTGFLGNFWRSGGLAGDRSTEAFFVVCDSSNNTTGTIDNGEVHVSVGVALSNPAEFVVINLSQWSGGASQATEATNVT